MTSDEVSRRAKANRLRNQIEGLKGSLRVDEDPADKDVDTPEMLPGESPHTYVERRMREIERKRRLGLSEEKKEQ